MQVEMKDGQVIVTLPKAVLVMSQAEFVAALKKGKAWRRAQDLARRQAEAEASPRCPRRGC
jgi:hypothetical protein